jgi:uncharacterized protein YcbK (DUF882 family)
MLFAAPLPAFSGARDFWTRPRELWIRHQHTGEGARVLYWERGALIPDGYRELCGILRDHHTGATVQMDVGVLNLAYGIQGWLADWGIDRPLVVTRAYSTPETNRHIEGAALDSQHPRGRAIDFYMTGIPAASVGLMAAYYRRGGVGFYPLKRHTHIDTGRVRYWAG